MLLAVGSASFQIYDLAKASLCKPKVCVVGLYILQATARVAPTLSPTAAGGRIREISEVPKQRVQRTEVKMNDHVSNGEGSWFTPISIPS